MVLENFFNWAFGPITHNLNPALSIIAIAFIITFITTLIYKLFTDQHLLKTIKEEVKVLQDEMKKHTDPMKKLELQKEMSKRTLIMMRHSFRPMFITLIPLLLIFRWLNLAFKDQGKILNILFLHLGWLGTYIIFSILFSIIIRKILKVH